MYNELNPELRAASHPNPWMKIAVFTPQNMEKEVDQTYLKRLGYFTAQFTVPREQLVNVYGCLTERLGGSPEYQLVEGESKAYPWDDEEA
jgi:hypothetical protein